jgi:hypothetical protein
MRRVARRKWLVDVGVAGRWGVLTLALAGILWLAGSRVFGFWSEETTRAAVMAAAGAALLAGVAATVWRRRLAPLDLARLIDRRTDSRDLFLTAAMIEGSPGEYRPLVLNQAEQRAAAIHARQVLPFHWKTGAQQAVGACVLLGLTTLYLPQWDVLGKGRERRQVEQRKAQLEDTRRATILRIADLQKQAGEPSRVEQAIAALEQTFQKAKPTEKEANLQRLTEHQKTLGEQWRQKADPQLMKALASERVDQSFGRGDPRQAEQMKEALRKGDVSALKKQLNDLQKQAERLAAMPDSSEKRQGRDQLQRQLGAMADAASKALPSPGLNASMSRALDQLSRGASPQMSSSALQATAESLGLSVQEAEALARSMQDLKSLEDALKSAQLAKQLNDQGKLNGAECAECKGIEDYAALYARVLGKQDKRGTGPGMGTNPGQGFGGKAQENGGAKTAYKPEKSPTALSGGKMLMQWKTNEASEPGLASQDYLASIQQAKQGVSEAIVQEQVPPGYHRAIQKYFDVLPPPMAGGQ